MYFQDKLKKKTSRETGKRERKEREMEKERVTTIYPNMIHVFIKKITWCCVLNTEVLSSEGFLQSHKNM